MSDLSPIAILLVTSGTRGDRLLFRYPYESEIIQQQCSRSPLNNPYALKISEERVYNNRPAVGKFVKNGILVGFEDKTLANLLAVKTTLCGSKFSVKIDDVRFVGFPMQLDHKPQMVNKQATKHRINTANIVFALHANIIDSAIDCYHAFAKQLIVAVKHEERRCQYLTIQSKIIRTVVDEVQALPEDSAQNPFKLILQKSQIANELKQVYISLVETGIVSLHINHWVAVSFCLPHKVHVMVTGSRVLYPEPKEVEGCLLRLRPYHGLLLLHSENDLLDSLPMDSSPSLVRLVKFISPVKNLQALALDTDLALSQVFTLACHLVYWGKAMVIYPLCETNIYTLSPIANTLVNSTLGEDFVKQFPGKSLHMELAEFSLPCQLREKRDVLEQPQMQMQRVQMVVWMLQRCLLMQLHTYVFFMSPIKKSVSASFVISARASDSSSSNVQVVEESMFSYIMEDHPSNLERAPSMSDVASVNSDESVGAPSSAIMVTGNSTSSFIKELSKSPSMDVTSDGSTLMEENKANWQVNIALKELTSGEKSAVLKCPAIQNPEDLQLFARIYPYFNGRHHLEEIMFYENLRRSHLLTLLDKFKDVLITSSHQDLATAFHTR